MLLKAIYSHPAGCLVPWKWGCSATQSCVFGENYPVPAQVVSHSPGGYSTLLGSWRAKLQLSLNACISHKLCYKVFFWKIFPAQIKYLLFKTHFILLIVHLD